MFHLDQKYWCDKHLLCIYHPYVLHLEVNSIMILLIRIIEVPVSSFPKGSGHFIQQFTLSFITEYMFSQTLFPGCWLFPQLFLISSLQKQIITKMKHTGQAQVDPLGCKTLLKYPKCAYCNMHIVKNEWF